MKSFVQLSSHEIGIRNVAHVKSLEGYNLGKD